MERRKWGDRRDGKRLKKLDAMHHIMPLIFPKRCESEVFMFERIDLTNLNAYIKAKNLEKPEYRLGVFQAIIAAFLKTIVLRPQLNRFIANQTIFQRNEISAAFVVKTSLSDDAEEAMAFINAEETDTLSDLQRKINEEINKARDLNHKNSTDLAMEIVAKLPSFLKWIVGCVMRCLDRHGIVPKSIVADDIHYASVVMTQLGSIKLNAGYHHLTDWGTNSLFIAVGEKKMRPYYDTKGNIEMRHSIDLGITVDERIADGFYFAKSIRLVKKLLENPELLELPLNEKVVF